MLVAEETKESNLPDNKTPSSTNWQTEGPLGRSLHGSLPIQPEGGPPSEVGSVTAPGSSGQIVRGRGRGGGLLREPYLPSHPGRLGSVFQLKCKNGWWWCLPEMESSPQKIVLRDRTKGPASKQTGTRGAAGSVLTKRLKLRRNIASKAAGRRAGLYWAV